jgi:hypothetical protein
MINIYDKYFIDFTIGQDFDITITHPIFLMYIL